MENNKIFELVAKDRKSFYGKARVIETADGKKQLMSYNTIVCEIDKAGSFHRLWAGESATTMRHINAFLEFFNLPGGGLAWWRSQEVA